MTTPQDHAREPSLSLARQLQLVREISRIAAHRAERENEIRMRLTARRNALQTDFQSSRERLALAHQQERAAIESQRKTSLEVAHLEAEEAARSLQLERQRFDHVEPERHRVAVAQRTHKLKTATGQLTAQHRAQRTALKQQAQRLQTQWAQHGEQAAERLAYLKALYRRRGVNWDSPPVASPPAAPSLELKAAFEDFQRSQWRLFAEALEQLRGSLSALEAHLPSRFIEDGWPVLLALGLLAAAAYPLGVAWSWHPVPWLLSTIAVAAGSTALARIACGLLRRRFTQRQTAALRQHASAMESALAQLAGSRRLFFEAESQRLRQQFQREQDALEREAQEQLDLLENQHARTLQERAAEFARQAEQIAATREYRCADAERRFTPQLEVLDQRHQELAAQRLAEFQAETARVEAAARKDLEALVAQWQEALAGFRTELAEMDAFCRRSFPAWSDVDWETWEPPGGMPQALRIGSYRVDLDAKGEEPIDPRLQLDDPWIELPSAMSLAETPVLLFESSGEGRAQAVRALQNVALRMLTSAPAGKIRLTIVDPEGLGQNFAGFMPLADFDPRLVGNRIWTEPGQINRQLHDLTEHLETVIQKYLRNEFDSIQQYNQQAGEVAEPYRILVVLNFPAGFTDEAAKRLVSIAGSGARCGVYTLLSVDTRKRLPRDVYLDDLERQAVVLQWNGERFRWKQEAFRQLPLVLDPPPGDPLFCKIVRAVGRRAQAADRVEVPFRIVAPPNHQWWQADSRATLEVPVGRAGATQLQRLQLGRGVAQHVLLSGKTGSGKSTLLHALITNLALHYAPDQLEFYLIDFKKGVEFKAYATQQLPHARVIAVESEREFGMSVLQRLDAELQQRGEWFREAGVQDLQGFRDALPSRAMPRVLLVIDEFQEFFVKDDRLASEASLLLDRLVRQGRAFGIHVLLGSQTLAGAYSLARSTLGQMAVRIALECSEADAHLILSEDNSAARLLSRPGEAIYNDANGRPEGNHPFQVAWLPDHQREAYLRQLREAPPRLIEGLSPPIVFEGNAPAQLGENAELCAPDPLGQGPRAAGPPKLWLGDPVAIKEPTHLVLEPKGGCNLLVVGNQPEAARSVLACAVASLLLADRAAGQADLARPCSPRVELFDGETPSAAGSHWRKLAHVWPESVSCHAPREAVSQLAELVREVEQRQEDSARRQAPVLLVIDNLARFRDLQRSEDDFSFSVSECDAVDGGKLLSQLIREGPEVGVHTVLWVDSYHVASRYFDRATLRELPFRVLFQMSGAESSNLMDSPEASRLGMHRALLYAEERGEFEKFRPYAFPDLTWLRGRVAERFAQ